jgi:hypothetical protein
LEVRVIPAPSNEVKLLPHHLGVVAIGIVEALKLHKYDGTAEYPELQSIVCMEEEHLAKARKRYAEMYKQAVQKRIANLHGIQAFQQFYREKADLLREAMHGYFKQFTEETVSSVEVSFSRDSQFGFGFVITVKEGITTSDMDKLRTMLAHANVGEVVATGPKQLWLASEAVGDKYDPTKQQPNNALSTLKYKIRQSELPNLQLSISQDVAVLESLFFALAPKTVDQLKSMLQFSTSDTVDLDSPQSENKSEKLVVSLGKSKVTATVQLANIQIGDIFKVAIDHRRLELLKGLAQVVDNLNDIKIVADSSISLMKYVCTKSLEFEVNDDYCYVPVLDILLDHGASLDELDKYDTNRKLFVAIRDAAVSRSAAFTLATVSSSETRLREEFTEKFAAHEKKLLQFEQRICEIPARVWEQWGRENVNNRSIIKLAKERAERDLQFKYVTMPSSYPAKDPVARDCRLACCGKCKLGIFPQPGFWNNGWTCDWPDRKHPKDKSFLRSDTMHGCVTSFGQGCNWGVCVECFNTMILRQNYENIFSAFCKYFQAQVIFFTQYQP